MATRELPVGTVTLLLTDVEGSTRALHVLGSGYGDSLALHREVVLDTAAAHGGVEVDSQGDSFLVAFARVDGALTAAEEIVRALDAVDWPGGVALRARVGVHTGEVERVGERYVGLELHRAARIGAAAHGGQVVVSAATRALGGERAFLDLGHHRLKGFERPERLFQLVDGRERRFPPLRTRIARALPRVPGTFVGRADEIEVIDAELRSGARVVTLTGAGGAGKSRLALEVAHSVGDRFAHGAALVRVGAVEAPGDVPAEIADALGIGSVGPDPVDGLLEHLRERQLLLVLDNLEHVLDAVAPLVARLVRETEALVVLGTSRGPLRIAGERVVGVRPLPERQAVELFADRARGADHRFVLDEATEPSVRTICHRLDGLPLAIEIVAARVRSVSVSDLAAGIGFDLRTEGTSDAPARHRTLEAAIAWGAANLEERLQRLHAQLGVFQSRFTTEAAVTAFDASQDDLDALVRAALLRRVDTEGPTRLTMLQIVREFALERLARDGLLDAAREARGRWVEQLSQRAAEELDRDDPGAVLADLSAWAPDIRGALRDAAERGDHGRCVGIVSSLERYWRARGEIADARAILTEALEVAPPDDHAARARAQWTLSRLALAQGDPRGAQAPLRDALDLYRAGGLARETAFALAELAWVALDLGELDEADAAARTALEVSEALDDRRAASSALAARATVAAERGEPAVARALAEECLAIRRALGDRQLVANAALTVGTAAMAQGDLAAAAHALRECLTLSTEIGDVLHAAAARCCLGEIDALGDRPVAAAGHLLDALGTFVRLGNDAAATECLVALASVEQDARRAALLLAAARGTRARTGVVPVPVEVELERRVVEQLGEAPGDGVASRLSLVEAALLAGVPPTDV